jgi:hypothetical protein
MTEEKPRATFSDRQARGGVIGGKGYGFQAAYIVSRIPLWLADPDFAAFIQEGAGDVDVLFKRAGGEERWYVQVKNYLVTPGKAREVFDEFRRADQGSAGTFTQFTLACPGLNPEMKSLRDAITDWRGLAPMYRPGKDENLDNTWQDLEEKVEALKLERADAQFLVDKVHFDTDLSGLTKAPSLRRLFVGSLLELHTWAGVEPAAARRAYEKLALLCHQEEGLRRTYTRQQVEDTIREAVGEVPSVQVKDQERSLQALVLWGKLPFPLADRVPPDQRRQHLDALPATFDPAGTEAEWLPSLPPVPILSLDPGDRVERAFKAAGVRLKVVRTRRDVPVGGQHNLLKLAGDLGDRSGVILSRAEIRELRGDADKRHLLDEAVRAAKGGALLLVGCDPAGGDFRAWWATLAPAFRDADLYALGDRTAPWPEGVDCLGSDLEAARAALEGTEVGSESEPELKHNISAVRDLLLAGFTGSDLRQLALYTSRPALKPLLHEFGSGDGLRAMVEKTITFCQKQDCMEDLLAEVKKENPRQYTNYESRLRT